MRRKSINATTSQCFVCVQLFVEDSIIAKKISEFYDEKYI